jgi:hypothetical protein
MTLSDDDKLAIAGRMNGATAANDGEAYAALCAPGALSWHNFDELEVSTEHTLRTVAWLHRTVPDLQWTQLELIPTPSGFVSKSIMTGTAPGGPLRVHSCVIVTLDDDGLITRVEEYLDSAQTAALRG